MAPINAIEQLTNLTQLSWLDACRHLEQLGQSYVIATVVAYAGSVPRDTGSKMVISDTSQFDTIGGGNLEYQVIQMARDGLKNQTQHLHIERFALSADLGQCCGGAVQILFEYFLTQTPTVAIFGAGHVSIALSNILSKLPCHVNVIDNRADWISKLNQTNSNDPIHRIETHCLADPTSMITSLPDNTYIVIMTQDHGLDFELARHCLEEQRFPYVGMIGSEGKNQRFRYRLHEQLSNSSLLDQFTCPIGLSNIKGKLPMQVAISVAAQFIALWGAAHANEFDTLSYPRHNAEQWARCNQVRNTIKES
jgi:xanthine dehydrogenase accessory factor